MSLTAMLPLLKEAEKQNIAVGAFSVGNMEMVMGAVKAAEEMNTPIILQIAEKRLKNSPLELMAPMMVSAAKNAKVDIAVHLDHGLTVDCIKAALSYGFTSVMLDCSLLPFEENVKKTHEVVALAYPSGATVEAELGVVGGNEGDTAEHKIKCTDPEAARLFETETGIDALAVAIGNAHGNYPVLPELRFDILDEINKATNVPLVLHGGSGIPNDMLKKAIAMGVAKININTENQIAAMAAMWRYFEEGKDRREKGHFVRNLARDGVEAMKPVLREKISVFGCAGRDGGDR